MEEVELEAESPIKFFSQFMPSSQLNTASVENFSTLFGPKNPFWAEGGKTNLKDDVGQNGIRNAHHHETKWAA